MSLISSSLFTEFWMSGYNVVPGRVTFATAWRDDDATCGDGEVPSIDDDEEEDATTARPLDTAADISFPALNPFWTGTDSGFPLGVIVSRTAEVTEGDEVAAMVGLVGTVVPTPSIMGFKLVAVDCCSPSTTMTGPILPSGRITDKVGLVVVVARRESGFRDW